ncbi:hypothetical protein ACFP3N_16320, partial [Alloalcanivorax gelatiniphagus]
MARRRLHEFVRALRGAGVRISPAEAEEAMRAAALVGYGDKNRFRETLALTLVKSEEERPDFDRCFETFFRFEDQQPGEQGPAEDAAEPATPTPPDAEGLSPQAAELAAQSDTQLEQSLAQAAAEIDFTAMQVITQQGLFARRLLMNMGMGAVDDEILRLDASQRPGDGERAEALRDWRGRVRERAMAHV